MAKMTPNNPELARKYFSDKMSFTTGPVEALRALSEGSIRLIDVRSKDDFEREHIPGSINLPEGAWATAEGLLRDQMNVLMCYSQVCHLAARAAVELAGKGYPVMELEGGFAAWKAHHQPTETTSEASSDAARRARDFLDDTRAAQTQRDHFSKDDASTDGASKDGASKDDASNDEDEEAADTIPRRSTRSLRGGAGAS